MPLFNCYKLIPITPDSSSSASLAPYKQKKPGEQLTITFVKCVRLAIQVLAHGYGIDADLHDVNTPQCKYAHT